METLPEHKNSKLRELDPFALNSNPPQQAQVAVEGANPTTSAKITQQGAVEAAIEGDDQGQGYARTKYPDGLPATLFGLLVSGDGEVTQAWLEQNFQKLQTFIRYLNNDLQFRLLGFIPPKVLLGLLLEEESAVRKRHFEWCCKHPSSRTARNTIHIKSTIEGWLDNYQYRLAIHRPENDPEVSDQSHKANERQIKE